jgi:hypothetical protein
MVHLLHGIVAVLVLEKANAEAVELLDDLVAILRVFIDGLLVDNAVIGYGDFLGVLLGRGVAGDDSVSPSMPMEMAPERLTFAFSRRTTSAFGFFSFAFSAAMGPAVPPPMTSTSQETSDSPSTISSIAIVHSRDRRQLPRLLTSICSGEGGRE